MHLEVESVFQTLLDIYWTQELAYLILWFATHIKVVLWFLKNLAREHNACLIPVHLLIIFWGVLLPVPQLYHLVLWICHILSLFPMLNRYIFHELWNIHNQRISIINPHSGFVHSHTIRLPGVAADPGWLITEPEGGTMNLASMFCFCIRLPHCGQYFSSLVMVFLSLRFVDR